MKQLRRVLTICLLAICLLPIGGKAVKAQPESEDWTQAGQVSGEVDSPASACLDGNGAVVVLQTVDYGKIALYRLENGSFVKLADGDMEPTKDIVCYNGRFYVGAVVRTVSDDWRASLLVLEDGTWRSLYTSNGNSTEITVCAASDGVVMAYNQPWFDKTNQLDKSASMAVKYDGSTAAKLSNIFSGSEAAYPSDAQVIECGGVLYGLYREANSAQKDQLVLKKWNGSSWTAVNSGLRSGKALLRTGGGKLYLFTADEAQSGKNCVYVLNGASWQLLGEIAGDIDAMDMTVAGDKVYAAAASDSGLKVYVLEADGFQQFGSTLTTGTVYSVDLLESGGVLHAVYTEGTRVVVKDYTLPGPKAVSLEITAMPKLEYLEGKDPFDAAEGELTLTFDNGDTEKHALSEAVITGFDNTKVGEQTLTVSYEDLTAELVITIKARTLIRVEVTEMPGKLEYLEGKDAFEPEGGKLTLIYDNDQTEEIELSEAEITGFDNTVIGEQTLTAAYNGFEDTFTVTVRAKKAVKLEIAAEPSRLEYLEAKDAFDPAGGMLALIYDNDVTEEIELSEAEITGFDNTVTGEQTLTVTYAGLTAELTVTIREKTLISVELTELPAKLEYLEAKDSFDPAGGVLILTYDNGVTLERELSEEDITGFDNTVIGEQTLTVGCEGLTTELTITIKARTLIRVEVTEMPVKQEYLEGKDAFEPEGGRLTLIYDNDQTEEIELSEAEITGFDNTVTGEQLLTASYSGLTAEFTVTIREKSLAAIEVSKQPDKRIYLAGKELFDPAGGKLLLTYDNGMTEEIELSEAEIEELDNAVLGEQQLKLVYDRCETYLTVIVQPGELEAIQVTAMPDCLIYLLGTEQVDLIGGKLTLIFEGGAEQEIELAEAEVTGFDGSVLGEQELTVSYGGKTTGFTVTVMEKMPVARGDYDDDGEVTVDDALYLLFNSFFPEDYPLNQDGDINGDGEVDVDDALYLLFYTFFPEDYPLVDPEELKKGRENE